MSKRETAKLGDISEIICGGTPKTSVPAYWADEIKWVTAKDVSESSGYKIYDSERKISRAGLENSAAKIIPSLSTALIARGATMGRSCMLAEDMAINQTCYAFIPNANVVNPYYLFYSIKSLYEFFQNIAHGAIFNTVIGSGLKETEIYFPPLPEQKIIAAVLSSLDDKIDLLQRQNQTLEALAQTLFRNWFIEEADDNWDDGELGDVIEIYDSKRIPLSKMQRSKMQTGKLYPYYGAATIMDYVNDYIFDGEYILLGEDGTVRTDDGYPVLQYTAGKFWVNNHAHIFQAKPPYSNFYLWCYLKQKNINEIVTGAVQPKINQTNLKSLDFPLAPLELVKNFDVITANMFEKMKANNKQISTLEKLRDTILPKLMSGEVRVRM